MLRVQGHAPKHAVRAFALAAALASASAFGEPAGPPAPPAPAAAAAPSRDPAAPSSTSPARGGAEPTEPEQAAGLVAFSVVLSAGPLPVLQPRYPAAYPAFTQSSFTEVQAQAGLDLAMGARLGPVVLGVHAELAYAGKPAFFAKDPLIVAGAGPRVEVVGEVVRFGVQASSMVLPRQSVFSLKDGLAADVGAQFGSVGLQLQVGYYRATAQYPSTPHSSTSESHRASLVPVTLGVRWEL
jgi:hypothetical protein